MNHLSRLLEHLQVILSVLTSRIDCGFINMTIPGIWTYEYVMTLDSGTLNLVLLAFVTLSLILHCWVGFPTSGQNIFVYCCGCKIALLLVLLWKPKHKL